MVDETTVGRQPITIIEIDQDFCSLNYGESPCTAAIGVTGTGKCYNTLPTCQDVQNFDKSFITLRFCTRGADFPKDQFIIPNLLSVSTTPQEINIGSGNRNVGALGSRTSISIRIEDSPSSDKLVDKYRTERDFDPMARGTFWSKWIARNKFYQNRSIRVLDGYVGQTLAEMRTRSYVIDRIDGPSSSGEVTIIAKDILKLADDNRALAPAPSNGVLSEDMADDATAFTIAPAGIGNLEYDASGFINIGGEIMSYTRSSDAFTVVRAQYNTEAKAHEAGDTVQKCLLFEDTRVESIMRTLLVDYGNVPSSYIPFTDWQAEAETWLSDYRLNAIIPEPTGVNQLLGELSEQCICYIWWDDINQEIPFKAIRPLDPSEDVIVNFTEDSNILAESLRMKRDPGARYSRLLFRYRQIDPTRSLTEKDNYAAASLRVDLDAETADEYNESRVKEVFSRWFTSINTPQIITTGSRFLDRYRDNPLYVEFSTDAKDRTTEVGDVIRLTHRNVVDSFGQTVPLLLQVIRKEEVESGHRVEFKCQVFGFIARYAFIMANDAPDYDDATEDEKLFGAWIAPNTERFDDSGDAYRIV